MIRVLRFGAAAVLMVGLGAGTTLAQEAPGPACDALGGAAPEVREAAGCASSTPEEPAPEEPSPAPAEPRPAPPPPVPSSSPAVHIDPAPLVPAAAVEIEAIPSIADPLPSSPATQTVAALPSALPVQLTSTTSRTAEVVLAFAGLAITAYALTAAVRRALRPTSTL